jgi:hypothetical protein
MNVIAVLDQSAPRRSVSDRWLDLRALMPAQDAGMELDETWQEFLVRPAQAGPHQAPMEHE